MPMTSSAQTGSLADIAAGVSSQFLPGFCHRRCHAVAVAQRPIQGRREDFDHGKIIHPIRHAYGAVDVLG